MRIPRKDEDKPRNWLRALLLMICTTFLWFASEAVFAKLRHYSIVQVVWTRYSIHLMCMLVLLGPRKVIRHARTKKLKLQIGRGALMIAMPILGVVAITNMGVAEFMAVFWLLPLLVLAIAQFFTIQQVHLRYWLVAIIAYLGVLAIFRPASELLDGEIFFALGSASSFSLYIVFTHQLQKTQSLNTNLLYTALVVVCFMTPALPYFWQVPSVVDGIKMCMLGVFGLAALWCIEKALEISWPADLAPVLFLFPLLGVTVRLLLSGSMPNPPIAIGSLMVIASLLAHHFMEIRQS